MIWLTKRRCADGPTNNRPLILGIEPFAVVGAYPSLEFTKPDVSDGSKVTSGHSGPDTSVITFMGPPVTRKRVDRAAGMDIRQRFLLGISDRKDYASVCRKLP